jgi:hypothetical protein
MVAPIANNRVAWTYTDDAGHDWRVAAILGYTAQAVLGGSAAASTVPVKPASIKMRRLSVRCAAIGITRTVPVYDGTASILTPAETVHLNDWVGAVYDVHTYVNDQATPVYIIPERHPRKSPITTQAS